MKILDVEYLSAEGDFYNKDINSHDNPVQYFLDAMNNQALELGLSNSHFDSPHGLANRENVHQSI